MDKKPIYSAMNQSLNVRVVERRISIKDRNQALGTIHGGRNISEVQDNEESLTRRTSFITRNMHNTNWKIRETHIRKLRAHRP